MCAHVQSYIPTTLHCIARDVVMAALLKCSQWRSLQECDKLIGDGGVLMNSDNKQNFACVHRLVQPGTTSRTYLHMKSFGTNNILLAMWKNGSVHSCIPKVLWDS